MAVRLLCLVIGYAFGLFQTAFILGKLNGLDIRKSGSGNAGTTNALRTLGLKAGVITFFADILKCIVAVLVTWLIFHNKYPDMVPLLKIWTSAGVTLGHIFPFYMGFKGGKGIAAMGGMIIAFGDPLLIALGLATFFGLLFLTHYASVASLTLITAFFVEIAIGNILGTYGMAPRHRVEMLLVVLALTCLGIALHKGNIQRLLDGTERKTYLKKSKEE